ncbi:hypothetical protein EDF38_2321 [Frigoribacterium sp. PhB160]|uniref:hypothetical protein n=1 Tax=Frigoribacterium sp. PhB160 TaxID=2485192 RepID=UPI000F495F9B|nr:hypothetical protein [Frigoribacterium sp. PhB160]ROS59472.1 hypothetical protein EDF38_2321 [Frigoribacterium sp. PhB160]
MAPRWTRFLRGWLTAGFSVVVAATSHVAGGGAAPGLLGVVLALAVAVPVSVALAGRRVRLAGLIPSVAVSQLAFHLLFSLGAASSAGHASASGGHHTPLVVSVAGGATGAAGTGIDAMAMSAGLMWAAHALAAVLTVVGIRWGAACLERLLRLAARRLAVVRLLLGAALRPAPEARVRSIRSVPSLAPTPLRFLTARPRRGPPRLV